MYVKNVSRRVSLLSKLKFIVDTGTRKLFFNAHNKPHIDYASVTWVGCSDVLKKEIRLFAQRSCKVDLSSTILTTDQKFKKMRTMRLREQLKYNKGLFVYRVLNDEAPEYSSNLHA